MNVKQYVMAYRADHDKIKALLPSGYKSLRPVLRVNAELLTAPSGQQAARIEFVTPVAARGKRGWLNLGLWQSPATPIAYELAAKHVGEPTKGSATAVKGETAIFRTDFLTIEYTGVGIAGGCPAENDNDGCFYLGGETAAFVPAESITAPKEYCDCEFRWTRPYMEAMRISADEILGAYQVDFER